MGALLTDSGTKGYIALSALSLTNAKEIEPQKLSGASAPMAKLLELLKAEGSKDGKPTEVTILINGDKETAFSFVVKDLSEIMEVLHWTVGRE